jgi:hypothetical protein
VRIPPCSCHFSPTTVPASECRSSGGQPIPLAVSTMLQGCSDFSGGRRLNANLVRSPQNTIAAVYSPISVRQHPTNAYHMKNAVCLIIMLLSPIAGCDLGRSINPVASIGGKPDLVIDTVTYKRLPSCWQGYPSGIICGGPRFEFTLRIANIGSTDIAEPFYISNSRSKWDFASRYCSFTIRVNDPPSVIPVGGSIPITYIDFIDDSTSHVLFVVNTNDRYQSAAPLPRLDEASYDNNEFDLPLNW